MKRQIKKIITLVLAIIFIIAITITFTGCVPNQITVIKFLSLVPEDNFFHPNTLTISVENSENGLYLYFYINSDPSNPQAETLVDQAKKMESGKNYRIETKPDNNTVISINPSFDK